MARFPLFPQGQLAALAGRLGECGTGFDIAFLRREWPGVFEAARKAEAAVHADPRTARFYAKRALALAVAWAFKHDPALWDKVRYRDCLALRREQPAVRMNRFIQDKAGT